MGEMVEFKSNGGTCTGYLAGTSGPGVIVIQEWWGLVPHITDIADRFAAEGFVALAPDMYHGEMTDEPDMAGKLLMSMNLATAGKDLSGAVDLLQERTGRTKVGVTGFCMGGGLALMAACLRPDAIAAAAPFYGGMRPDTVIEWDNLAAVVEGHYAATDRGTAAPEAVKELEATLRAKGKDATFHVYPGTQHAFFNDTRPEVYDAAVAKTAWDRTLALFRANL
ncbi:MAG: dienelactone hydrolase family protein [Ilumatobacteraceae bacterium]|jgi:carboxymethylenebutenolidase|nr:dienelactone hydrolase family protein [Ilumatobacteraceae bacterium]MDP5068928.1 dienelactone hydrolase family protein [Ilumatobacteraceae bacterium]